MGDSPLVLLIGALLVVMVGVGAFLAGKNTGRRTGRDEELERQRAAKATAEESA
jgi:hypothetical protein